MASDLVIQITENCDGETTVYWQDQDNAACDLDTRAKRGPESDARRPSVSLANYQTNNQFRVFRCLPEVEAFADSWVNKVTGRSKRLGQT